MIALRRRATRCGRRICCALALLPLLAGAAAASSPVLLDDPAGSYPLAGRLEVLEDPGRSLTLDDVRSPEVAARFTDARDAVPNFGLSSSAYWVRARLRATRTAPDGYLLAHSLSGLAFGVAALLLLLDPVVALVAAAGPAVLYLGLSGAVSSVGHTFGKRPYNNSATNLQWLALLTAGEGLHNNHHAAPTSARFSLNRGEWDPSWLPIRVFRRLHLLTVRHDTPVLAPSSS